MPHITQQILTLLEDDSFPSMVMLDGEWGAGKTYYVKSELIPMLEKKQKKVFFFSLIGLSSIDDFRDKLISSVYLSEKVDNDLLGKLRNGAFAILNNTTDNGGTITSILKGSTGAVKHAMLNRINGITIILDDLERLSNTQLAKEIVGECLQLTDDNNLEFIFVMNGNETSIDKAMLEKSFSDRVYFKRTAEDSLNIIFKEFTYFHQYKDLIEKNIQKLEFTNLRVMKRAANRLNKIFEIVSKDKSIYLDKSMELIIEDVFRISDLYYCLKKTEKEITNILNHELSLKEYVKRAQNIEHDDKNSEFNKHKNTRTPSNEIIHFCCGKTHIPPLIDQLGRLPIKESPIDNLIFSYPYELEDSEFITLLDKLKNFIFEKIQVSISLWFEACEYYLYLLSEEFIEGNKDEFINNFDGLCSKKNFTISCLGSRNHTLKINTQEILDKFKQQKKEYLQKSEIKETQSLYKEMKNSWNHINYEEYRHKKLISRYSASEWMDLINNWKNKDIGAFHYFLCDRSRFGTNLDFLYDEKKILRELSHLIENEINLTPYNRKRGLLNLLMKVIKSEINKP